MTLLVMTRLSIIVAILVAAPAEAEPVRATVLKTECSTEPAPRSAIVRAGARRRGAALFSIVASSDLAQRTWRVVGGNVIDPVPLPPDAPVAMGGTCKLTMSVSPLAKGTATLRVLGRVLAVPVD
jgi:hypothetical protein